MKEKGALLNSLVSIRGTLQKAAHKTKREANSHQQVRGIPVEKWSKMLSPNYGHNPKEKNILFLSQMKNKKM